ncbi:MAG: arginase family protein [Rhodocyclales bacterium]|nr:arginase family protein [Rhodocyclales bacterium]
MAPAGPLILDFDQSVLPLPDSERLPLGDRQESVRFGCALDVLQRLAGEIRPAASGRSTVFLGSGDFHHLSHLLIQGHARRGEMLQVVVFDNHPDNMRYPFGIHCGSWVWHVSRLPFVSCVHVLGITSPDVGMAHAWENRLAPLRSGRVRYWCVGPDLNWMKVLGIATSRSFGSIAEMLDAFAVHIHETTGPIYLSVDKDVLSPSEARTNWDQGVMRMEELGAAIRGLRDRIIASDVTGDVSIYRYRSRLKRLLSGLDGQPEIAPDELLKWQAQHQSINRQLLDWLNP